MLQSVRLACDTVLIESTVNDVCTILLYCSGYY